MYAYMTHQEDGIERHPASLSHTMDRPEAIIFVRHMDTAILVAMELNSIQDSLHDIS